MKRLSLAFAFALALGTIAPLHAQTTPVVDDSLYQALGGRPALARLMDDFLQRLRQDRRMNPFFKDVNAEQFKSSLAEQLCEVAGGPCRYKGPDMASAHSNIDVTRADFNALVEVLQRSMDAQGIAFATQNRLLARLAPMHRDVINTR